jgi:hypothetical protein
MKPGHLLFIIFILVLSCSNEDICDQENHFPLVARFKTVQENLEYDTIVNGVSLYGIRAGLPDSLLYDSISLSRIELPLDPNGNQCSFVLETGNQKDTIDFTYQTEVRLISYGCGFGTFFTLENPSHTNLMIQQINIINSLVGESLEQDEEHLWIYF